MIAAGWIVTVNGQPVVIGQGGEGDTTGQPGDCLCLSGVGPQQIAATKIRPGGACCPPRPPAGRPSFQACDSRRNQGQTHG